MMSMMWHIIEIDLRQHVASGFNTQYANYVSVTVYWTSILFVYSIGWNELEDIPILGSQSMAAYIQL